MKYLLMNYGNEAAEAAVPKSAMEQTMSAYMAYSQALVKAGVMVGGERLKPSSTATRVRLASARQRCWMARTRTARSNSAGTT